MEKKKSYGVLIVGAILLILGIVLAVITHNNSYQESVAYGSQLSDFKAKFSTFAIWKPIPLLPPVTIRQCRSYENTGGGAGRKA